LVRFLWSTALCCVLVSHSSSIGCDCSCRQKPPNYTPTLNVRQPRLQHMISPENSVASMLTDRGNLCICGTVSSTARRRLAAGVFHQTDKLLCGRQGFVNRSIQSSAQQTKTIDALATISWKLRGSVEIVGVLALVWLRFPPVVVSCESVVVLVELRRVKPVGPNRGLTRPARRFSAGSEDSPMAQTPERMNTSSPSRTI
jgi:hypothetical protein